MIGFRKVVEITSKKLKKPMGSVSRLQAREIIETSYLAAASALIWVALYYLPIGGALFRLVLPLPLTFLQVRRNSRVGLEGVVLSVLLLVALMGPVRGPLMLFPYGLLALWLGWSWRRGISWWFSWGVGVFIGTTGFLVRVAVLSLLVGENLWVVITRAGSAFLDGFLDLFHIPLAPALLEVQLMALALIVLQELVYVLALHALAFWLFPRLNVEIPDPPRLLYGLVVLDPF